VFSDIRDKPLPLAQLLVTAHCSGPGQAIGPAYARVSAQTITSHTRST